MFLFSGEKIYPDKFIQSHKTVSQWLRQFSNSVLLDLKALLFLPYHIVKDKAQILDAGERMNSDTIYKERKQERE